MGGVGLNLWCIMDYFHLKTYLFWVLSFSISARGNERSWELKMGASWGIFTRKSQIQQQKKHLWEQHKMCNFVEDMNYATVNCVCLLFLRVANNCHVSYNISTKRQNTPYISGNCVVWCTVLPPIKNNSARECTHRRSRTGKKLKSTFTTAGDQLKQNMEDMGGGDTEREER